MAAAFLAAAVLVTLDILWQRHELSRLILTAAALFSLVATAIPVTALWLSHGRREIRSHQPAWRLRTG